MKHNYKFIDLFAGCGGLSEGFYMQGFEALVHVEIDKFACETLKKRMEYYGYTDINNKVLEHDITDSGIIDRLNEVVGDNSVDIIIGGPPCQSFSTLGRAKDEFGMQNDPRNFLFESYVRILNYFKPKFFVFENVTGLLTAEIEGKKIINLILKELGKNYKLLDDVQDMVLNSVHYGVPQERNRVIILGVRKDLNIATEDIYNMIEKTHYSLDDELNKANQDLKKYLTVKDAISDLPKLRPGEGEEIIEYVPKKITEYVRKLRVNMDNKLFNHVARNHNSEDMERYREMAKNRWSFMELLDNRPDLNHENPRLFGNSYVVQRWDQPSKTIIAHLYKDGNQFIHPDYTQSRTLTAREAARLQSFPDDFEFPVSRTQQYKQIGNAVPPLLAEVIAKAMKKGLDILNLEGQHDI